MDFKEIIKRHLDKMAQQDFAFAERYKLESKNLNSCCDYIRTQAKKHAEEGCAAIEDAVVYGWAVHYYMEDSVKIDTTAKAKVTTSKDDKPKESKPKQVKALVKDKKEDKCIQLDMFADF
jgi:site-specific recombinase XerD